jgi:hypothetical protein
MTSVTLQVPDKFHTLLSDTKQLHKITSYIVDDYLTELYQDALTKQESEKSEYDKDLNNQLKKAL